MMKFWRIVPLSLLLCAAVISVGCQKGAPVDSAEAASKLHLRAAMIALDKGDEKAAENELGQSLAADPMNQRARTTLASLFSKQAGLSLQDWLNPFWDAGRQLEGRIHTVQQSAQMIDEVSADISAVDQESISQQELKIRAHVASFAGDAARFSLGASVVLDVFQTIPYLRDSQLVKLDKAIKVLRVDGIAPVNRDEEQRVYLSVLSFVRLINHLKRVLGNSPTYDISAQREKVCALDIPTLKEQFREIHLSLTMLEEGLVVRPNDPQTSQRTARVKVQLFVSSSLKSPVWDRLEEVFDPSTLDGLAVGLYARRICPKLDATRMQLPVDRINPVVTPHLIPSSLFSPTSDNPGPAERTLELE